MPYTQICERKLWENYLSTNILFHSLVVFEHLCGHCRKCHILTIVKLHFGDIIFEVLSCKTTLELSKSGEIVESDTAQLLWTNSFNKNIASLRTMGAFAKVPGTQFCEGKMWSKHFFTKILFLSIRTVWIAVLGICGKRHILNSAQVHLEENVFEPISCLPTLQVFQNLCEEPCRRWYLLDIVTRSHGETIFQRTCFTKREKFEKLCGNHEESAIYSILWKTTVGKTFFYVTSCFTKLEVFETLSGAQNLTAIYSTLRRNSVGKLFINILFLSELMEKLCWDCAESLILKSVRLHLGENVFERISCLPTFQVVEYLWREPCGWWFYPKLWKG